MSDGSSTPESFAIEAILDRKGKKGSFQYFIKWDGYDTDENTWEERVNLVKDGFKEAVDEYDKKVSGGDRKGRATKAAASGGRARSKTPVRRTPAKNEEALDDEEEEEDRDETEEDDSAPGATAKRGSADESTRVGYWWPLFFFSSILLSVVLHGLKQHLEYKEGGKFNNSAVDLHRLNILSLINDPMPMLLCLRAVMMYAPSNDFTNRVCVLLLWAGMAKLMETFPLVSEPGETSHSRNTVLFCMGVWQFLAVWALYAAPQSNLKNMVKKREDKNSDASDAAFFLSFASFVLAGALLVHHNKEFPEAKRFSTAEYAVLWLSICATFRAIIVTFVSLLSKPDTPFSTWLELFGTLLGSLFVIVQILENHDAYKGKFPPERIYSQPTAGFIQGKINLPLFQITLDVFAWASAAAFMCSSIFYQE
mmetsp:Transcript_11252/g.18374  ORF Transcript_11252/g.18374 Transcript_11252/m.18374 type:complete len:423 (-) Transcript_11252:1497-2765(-)|eukprot:CAMPEP_0203757944 /NCGR_PEP_ID=MMETSP0098-20131031/10771_1 /ASSEMBLY_ACC=CAM_ASM_000208 /TAXON_ID=96639 /ORGANISM=" , Strain NY0313808BC1" /LENGTH=422 /DNA_ID=CAMNT_0050650189 /DNA_START=2318 /DNA_END=3586 /DNA_ORIENTATION=-